MRRNALHNANNPYQGTAKKVLCVCSAGLLRSPTAAVVLQQKYGYNTRSCGIHDYALIQYDEVLEHWADEIVVVNGNLALDFNFPKDKLIVLDIPDMYDYMNPELQNIIIEQYENTPRNS